MHKGNDTGTAAYYAQNNEKVTTVLYESFMENSSWHCSSHAVFLPTTSLERLDGETYSIMEAYHYRELT